MGRRSERADILLSVRWFDDRSPDSLERTTKETIAECFLWEQGTAEAVFWAVWIKTSTSSCWVCSKKCCVFICLLYQVEMTLQDGSHQNAFVRSGQLCGKLVSAPKLYRCSFETAQRHFSDHGYDFNQPEPKSQELISLLLHCSRPDSRCASVLPHQGPTLIRPRAEVSCSTYAWPTVCHQKSHPKPQNLKFSFKERCPCMVPCRRGRRFRRVAVESRSWHLKLCPGRLIFLLALPLCC